MQNVCSECSKRLRQQAQLCFWCGRYYTEEGQYSWTPDESECSDKEVATAVGLRKLPLPEAGEKIAGQMLNDMLSGSQEGTRDKAAITNWMERLKKKGVVVGRIK